MSHLFATTLLLTLGAGSAGLLTVTSPSAQPFYPSSQARVGEREVAPVTLAESLAQASLPPFSVQVAQAIDLPIDDQSPGAIAVNICLNMPDWQRPSEAFQAKQLAIMPRYSTLLATDPLAEMAKAWWSHEIFSFTTYGLSARTDPLYLSGVWTALDATWDCYNGDQPEQINQGALAEMWLLHHRLVNLEWQDSQYRVTVEPTGVGLQLVQFPRRESNPGLPLSIVTTTGQALAVMSGDW